MIDQIFIDKNNDLFEWIHFEGIDRLLYITSPPKVSQKYPANSLSLFKFCEKFSFRET